MKKMLYACMHFGKSSVLQVEANESQLAKL